MLTVILGDTDNESWDEPVLDTDVEPETVFDFTGVAVLLGEIVDDLDTRGDRVGLTLRVPVLETDDEPDTEFVELRDTMEVWEAILVVDIEADTDGDDVVELVGQGFIVSDIVCELDPV